MTHYNPYAQRKLLRAFEKLWAKFEGFINRFTKSDFNPFYHLGTLTIFMLIVLIATGTAGLVALLLLYPDALLERGTSSRIDIWQIALGKILQQPWLGFGFQASLVDCFAPCS